MSNVMNRMTIFNNNHDEIDWSIPWSMHDNAITIYMVLPPIVVINLSDIRISIQNHMINTGVTKPHHTTYKAPTQENYMNI